MTSPRGEADAVSPRAVDMLRVDLRRVLAAPETSQCLLSGLPSDREVSADSYSRAIARHRIGITNLMAAPSRSPAIHRRYLIQSMQMARVTDALKSEGIRVLHIKGPALAAQTTGDPMARGPGDVDVLIAPKDTAVAYAALTSAGWQPRPGYPRPGASWTWRHLISSWFEIEMGSPVGAIDLHWRLDPSPSAAPPFDVAWEERVQVEVFGRRYDTLSPRHALTHSALHAARDDWRWLRSLVDVHRLAADSASWEDRSRLLGNRAVLMTLAVTRASLGLPAGVPDDVLESLDSRRWLPAIRRAAIYQEGPAELVPRHRLPTAHWTLLRRHLRAARTPDDVLRVVAALTLMPQHLGDIESSSAATAIPRAVVARASYGLRVLRRGRDEG